jgi:hypothetical protein
MAYQHPSGNGKLTANDLTGTYVRKATPYLVQSGRRSSGFGQERLAEPEQTIEPVTGNVGRIDWQSIALWIFVAVSFATFVFAGYLLWAKCHGAPTL